MDHITIINEQSEEMVVNIGDLRRRFSQLSDRRSRQGRIYPLWYLLTVICLTKLSGEHTPTGISEWIRLRYHHRLAADDAATLVLYLDDQCLLKGDQPLTLTG